MLVNKVTIKLLAEKSLIHVSEFTSIFNYMCSTAKSNIGQNELEIASYFICVVFNPWFK